MNKVLKWILIGLGIALVVSFIAMIAFRGFVFRPSLMMGGRDLGFHHPMGGMMFGMGLYVLVRVLLGGTVLGLAVFGLISLFRNQKNIHVNPANPVASESQTAPVNIDPQRTCIKCSQVLQSDWKNCPYCGKKQ